MCCCRVCDKPTIVSSYLYQSMLERSPNLCWLKNPKPWYTNAPTLLKSKDKVATHIHRCRDGDHALLQPYPVNFGSYLSQSILERSPNLRGLKNPIPRYKSAPTMLRRPVVMNAVPMNWLCPPNHDVVPSTIDLLPSNG
jgi:hypothetical protein